MLPTSFRPALSFNNLNVKLAAALRTSAYACVCAFALAGCAGIDTATPESIAKMAAGEARMPEISAETLSERKVTLPKDLQGERTLVLVAFARSQQKSIDTWVIGLNLMKSPISWIEAPVIDKPNALFQSVINGGMRSGIPDPFLRDRTITLYTSRQEFIAAMKFRRGAETIYASVVDRNGKVWATAEGDYSEEKAANILAALKVPKVGNAPNLPLPERSSPANAAPNMAPNMTPKG